MSSGGGVCYNRYAIVVWYSVLLSLKDDKKTQNF